MTTSPNFRDVEGSLETKKEVKKSLSSCLDPSHSPNTSSMYRNHCKRALTCSSLSSYFMAKTRTATAQPAGEPIGTLFTCLNQLSFPSLSMYINLTERKREMSSSHAFICSPSMHSCGIPASLPYSGDGDKPFWKRDGLSFIKEAKSALISSLFTLVYREETSAVKKMRFNRCGEPSGERVSLRASESVQEQKPDSFFRKT
mmetsp:Transcript_10348/g.20049  ORF Transcript_10348/g.20049 Transcript_10348/m.20049 type:complete len:201 (-) Transcript_10348:105-707(-)